VAVRTELNMRSVSAGLDKLARLVGDFSGVARDIGGHMTRAIKDSFRRLGRSQRSTPGMPPATRSGGRGLLGSFTFTVEDDGDRLEVGSPVLYSDVVIRGTREALGGPIRPKRAKALTIPLTREARAKRARDIPGLFVVKPRPGADPEHVGTLARQKGKSGVEPLYVLRSSVEIGPHPIPSYEDEIDYIAGALERAIEKELSA